jgi:hypothetical protein
MRSVPLKRCQKILRRARQSSRRLILELLEDRLVPSQIQDGWIVVDATGNGSDRPPGIYAIDPNTQQIHPIATGTGAGFQIPEGLYEDPSSGMIYAGDEGLVPNLPGRFGAIVPTPTGTMFDHRVIKVDPNTSNPADDTGRVSLVTYDEPNFGENLYGTDGLVYLNGKIYVINQGDGGGNLHVLVNPDDLNNPKAYDPPTHSVIQIDPNTGIQTSVYNDGDHSAPVPRDPGRHPDDAAYPTGSNNLTGYPDNSKSLDAEEDPVAK